MAFAILLYLITLAPVANVFRLIGATMAERFLYIPSLGYCLVLTLILVKFSNAEIMKSKASTLKYFFSNNSKLFVLVLGIVCLYSLKTLARIPDWKNNTALFSADAATVPKSARAHIHYAITLFEDEYPKEKNEITKNQILDKSIEEFKKGLDIYPDYQLTYEGLGEAYMKKSDYYNAINYFELSVSKFDEGKSRAFRFLVTCYENTNQWDKQITANDSVLKYEPQDVNAYVNKGTVFGKKGNYNDAIICFEKALSINSNEVAAYKDLGAAYGYLKNYPKAIEYLNKAASLDATDSQIPAFIGLTYKNMGDSIKAKSFFDKAAMMNNKK